ncbi:response regulator containing a CheY-like receiver domain and an HTH DNA-binding domain [Synechococcus sp. PCC 7502]|uniref:response regulator transcription factor n=1 Tax=Synechococcus sp. PCC 7502 TaxID=1173263 RepID=UPI00029FEB9D|nr:response regulator transcription factor [Synechococcus sp. PCC 7502]AFY73194.1 response regulator containing a CheY-like receiver domain and an HTH DNA-binding domain [Synechococcus sp. PCC 7502]
MISDRLKILQILLVEDDELFRLGLQVRLQQEVGIEITDEAEDGETALDLAKQQAFDLVLLDIGLPGLGGIETCRQFQQQHPKLPILVLTSHTERSLIAQLVEVGARGYCVKGIATEKLILAIRSVAAGASWWDATATLEIQSILQSTWQSDQLVQKTNQNEAIALTLPLTQREQEILALMVTGKTNAEIAEILFIAHGTVRVHVHGILHKLGVHDRKQAISIAIRQKLVSPIA